MIFNIVSSENQNTAIFRNFTQEIAEDVALTNISSGKWYK